LGQHQTGHNSGVLHTGIYYKPGSLKARTCTAGRLAMIDFCAQHGIKHEVCGKVVVAVSAEEQPRLQKLHERAQANGVKCDLISRERLAELEPAAQGVEALHVPEAGIADYSAVVDKMAELLRSDGADIHIDTRVTGIRETPSEVILQTTRGAMQADRVINCAGLHSDRIARLGGQRPQAKIIPFRGEYYKLRPGSPELCRNLIYPVPDPAFPFLGVHFTRMVNGEVEAGPNAVLAFAREGYTKLKINPRDLLGSLTYPGFLKLAVRYWRVGAGEMWRSVSKRAFVHALQRLVPAVRSEHLEAAPAGVRAQAISREGAMVDDFLIERSERIVHVCNAPSPAATASLMIGQAIAEKLRE
jgi:L-2-hydroxyglutarate oxidase